MEPKFQTSFIPKRPIVTGVNEGTSSNVIHESNLLSLAATVIFASVVLASGGLFGYKMFLQRQITQADTEINTARSAFQVDKIKELIDANNRIVSTKLLLEKHVTLSKLLYLFQELTVKRIRLLKLSYTNVANVPTINIQGEALSYNALADQSNIFLQSQYLKNSQFSNFVLVDNGNIKVDFSSSVDTSLISYKKAIESMNSTETSDTTSETTNTPQ